MFVIAAVEREERWCRWLIHGEAPLGGAITAVQEVAAKAEKRAAVEENGAGLPHHVDDEVLDAVAEGQQPAVVVQRPHKVRAAVVDARPNDRRGRETLSSNARDVRRVGA